MSDIKVEDAKEQAFVDNIPNNEVDDNPSMDDPKSSVVHDEIPSMDDPKSSDVVHDENPMLSPQEEEEIIKKKYGGMLPKKPPLISKDHERAFFDSADWALGKQGTQKTKGLLEALRPKLQPTPHHQLRSRSAYAPADDGEDEDDSNDNPSKNQSCKLEASDNNHADSGDQSCSN
ncbi:uncharacterized protein LOC130768666 [Actinidia eriantha]|uniref:uncharacterized protein LOC130768666 n=1 Tax=Actinidia eriantha TaxID=165200 RepID=UPI00258B192A|nr:uncharacterized protein LOC130768666 [Actinidia eriantha]XP_057481735.1 uncharacterized protein LOC130768666 [Actinidia eriantha]